MKILVLHKFIIQKTYILIGKKLIKSKWNKQSNIFLENGEFYQNKNDTSFYNKVYIYHIDYILYLIVTTFYEDERNVLYFPFTDNCCIYLLIIDSIESIYLSPSIFE